LLETIAAQQARPEMNHHGQLADPEPQIERAGELQKKWATQLGQLWAIGPHRLLCGDCRLSLDVGRLWGDGGRIRMIWTDLYGVNNAAKNQYLNRTDRGSRIQKPIQNDSLSPEETKALFQMALKEGLAFAANGAVCYASVPSGPLLPYFIAGFEGSGLSFKHLLIWVKQHFVIGMSDYHYRHEPILYGWIENGANYFADDRTQVSVFEVEKPYLSDLHPTTKPVELVARMIANSSRGELVYDPFCGSGTTLLAAHQLGRIGYGIDIDPGYVAVVLERMSQLGLKPELAAGSAQSANTGRPWVQ
jgi:hypothetical protein